MRQLVWPKEVSNIPLMLGLTYSYAPISGLNEVYAEVYRNSDDYVLNWSTMAFVSGVLPSGLSLGQMSEVAAPGLYKRNFNPEQAGQTQFTQIYYVRYIANIPSGYNSVISSDLTLYESEIHMFTHIATSGADVMTTSFTG